MAEKIQIPITSCSAKVVTVPDHFKLADSLQLALNQLGDGFFPIKGTMVVGGVVRNIKDLNGETIPGTGLQIRVRDYVAMIDGTVLSDKNKEQFEPNRLADLTVAVGKQYIVLRPKHIVGSDGFERKDFDRGDLTVEAQAPVTDSGAILVAEVTVPSGATQVTAEMIDNSVRDYLVEVGVGGDGISNVYNDLLSPGTTFIDSLNPGGAIQIRPLGLDAGTVTATGGQNTISGGHIKGAQPQSISAVYTGGTLRLVGGDADYTLHCFAAGTPVSMADGSTKPIEEVKAGDFIKSFDVVTGLYTNSEVTRTFQYNALEYISLRTSAGNELKVTPEHLFYVNGAWKEAHSLSVGDALLTPAGTSESVSASVLIKSPISTFSFEVKGTEAYFAGVLVHNYCFAAGTPISMADGTFKGIEDIKVGDVVKSYDNRTKTLRASEVTALKHHTTSEELAPEYLLLKTSGGREIKVTPNHLFHSKGVWKEAAVLKVGDELLNDKGETETLASSTKVVEEIPTYNFEVKNTHSYFATGILVHNVKTTVSFIGGDVVIQGGSSSGGVHDGKVVISGAVRIPTVTAPTMGQVLSAVDAEGTVQWVNAPTGGGEFDREMNTNLAKTNFKVDTLLNIGNNELEKGFIDVFSNAGDMDDALSTGYQYSREKKLVVSQGKPSGLAGYWKFDEGSGLAAVDSSGNGLDGSMASPIPYVPGLAGTALEFPGGEDNWVNLGSTLKSVETQEFSVCAWVKPTSYTSKGGATLNDIPIFTTSLEDGAVGLGFKINAYGISLLKNPIADQYVPYLFLAGVFYYVSAVQHYSDGVPSYVEFFVNGLSIGTFEETTPYVPSTGLSTIMGWDPGSNQAKGTLDEVAVFDRVLTPAEILWMYNVGTISLESAAIPANVVSKAHTTSVEPAQAFIVAEGTPDLQLFASRDNGATFYEVPNSELTDISGQASGTQMRYKVVLPSLTSVLDNIAMFWK